MLSEEGKLWVYWIGEARISLVNILFIYLFIYLSIYLLSIYLSIFYLYLIYLHASLEIHRCYLRFS